MMCVCVVDDVCVICCVECVVVCVMCGEGVMGVCVGVCDDVGGESCVVMGVGDVNVCDVVVRG